MASPCSQYFERMAAEWDKEPRRIALMKAIGEQIARVAQPGPHMDVLDYGCGTGLLGLYLLPHVRSVTGADVSQGMLDVLNQKIARLGPGSVRTFLLNLEQDDPPDDRYDLIVVGMALHHMADVRKVLAAFFLMLRPGGRVCIADLDTEPGIFHGPHPEEMGVHHFGFDREELKAALVREGFRHPQDLTASSIRRPIEGEGERDFSVFLITALAPDPTAAEGHHVP